MKDPKAGEPALKSTVLNSSHIKHLPFRNAVAAIDNGDIAGLTTLIDTYPLLLTDRLDSGEQGYFKHPFLLYFIAANPIRDSKLPDNIIEITRLIVDKLKWENVGTLQEQLDYTLELVSTGNIVKECRVQIKLMDLLLEAGARPNDGLSALAHGNQDAARHLIQHGGRLSLPTAAGLGMHDEVNSLIKDAEEEDKTTALAVSAFYGLPEMLDKLLKSGINPNTCPTSQGFHSHATPLHHAVSSGSLPSVELLIAAGAEMQLADRIYQGTALDWARHLRAAPGEREARLSAYAGIEKYLESLGV